jgi:pimeloyl-ACP methyl ester carboxylesterase
MVLSGLLTALAFSAAVQSSSEEVTVPASGGGELAGAWVAGAGPAAVIIPGSGPTNRDGDNRLGAAGSPYRRLAEGLAEAGIGSIRADKRGMFESASAGDPNDVTLELYASDTGRWMDLAAERSGADCIWLIGHSEGGLVAIETAHERDDVCGLVLLAAPGRPASTVLREQLAANPANAPILDQANAAISTLETGERVDVVDLHPALARSLFAPQLQGFLISLFAFEPAAELARTDIPVLIVQGDRDRQVSVEDARLLQAAREDVSLEIIAGAGHTLKPVPTDIAGYRQAGLDPELGLADGVVEAITAFINNHP